MRPGFNHFVQFYKDDSFLTKEIMASVADNLDHGCAILLILTRPHSGMILNLLSQSGRPVAHLLESGRLAIINAETLVGKITIHNWPDRKLFFDAIEPLFVEKQRKFGKIAAYGELVNLLWQSGATKAAVRLEELWNELSERYPFALYCGYQVDVMDPKLDSEALEGIYATHSSHSLSQKNQSLLDEAFRKPSTIERTMTWIKQNFPVVANQIQFETENMQDERKN